MEPSRLTLPASVGSITIFREFVHAGAVAAGVSADEFGRLDLVLEEILINVARYAYPPEGGLVEVVCSGEGNGRLRVEIADWGLVFNPLQADPPDLSRGLADRPIGGLGVFLVKSMVDSIEYCRQGSRNVLAFTFPSTDGAV